MVSLADISASHIPYWCEDGWRWSNTLGLRWAMTLRPFSRSRKCSKSKLRVSEWTHWKRASSGSECDSRIPFRRCGRWVSTKSTFDYALVGEQKEGLVRNLPFVEFHNFVEVRPEFTVHLNVEVVVVDFVGVVPNYGRRGFLPQFFFRVFGKRLFLRKLSEPIGTGLM